jgi:AcrR family transcriptional regulator
MIQSKKGKPIIEGEKTFSNGKSYPGRISGSKDEDTYVNKSEEIKDKNLVIDTEERGKILGYAVESFLKEGFYKTTMDEIAAKLHMSKKTIYKYFPSKEELVREVMETHMHLTMKKIKSHVNHQSNAVEKLFDIFNIVGENVLKVNEKMIMDLQYYSPGIWKEVDDFRAKQITANFSRIFEQGKAENYFLNIDTKIILSIFVASIRAIVNPDYALNSGVSLQKAFMTIIEVLMNGILNEKGKKIFNKLKNGVTK